MSETILEAKHLYFSYDNDQTHSLNDFSLKIEKGKKIAVMGSNGSGKSTFSSAATESTALLPGICFFTEKKSVIPAENFWS